MDPAFENALSILASHSSSEEYEGAIRNDFAICDVKFMS